MWVDDLDAQWRRLVLEGGLQAELSLRRGDFAQRHFNSPDRTASSSR